MSLSMNYVFDATQHKPDVGFEPVPADTYSVSITDTAIEAIKDNKGQLFVATFTVTEGPYVGRKLINRYNLWHTSEEAVRISNGQFSALCHVVGIFRVDMNSAGADLRGARLRVRVDNDGKYNSVKEVFDVNGNKPASAGTGYAPASPAASYVAAVAPSPQQQASPAAAPAQGWSAPTAPAQQQQAYPPQAPTVAAAPQQPAAQPAWQQQAAPVASQAPWNNTQPTA